MKYRTISYTVLAVLSTVLSCSAYEQKPETTFVTPSELAANRNIYDGKYVHVKGFVVIGPEQRNIYDSEEISLTHVGTCLGLSGQKKFFRKSKRKFIDDLAGTYRSVSCRADQVCLFSCYTQGGIDVDPSNPDF